VKAIKELLCIYPDKHFDAVITKPLVDNSNVIEQYNNWLNDNIWDEINRVLKPGAHIVSASEDDFDMVATQMRLTKFEIRDNIRVLHTSDVDKSINLFRYLIKLVMPPKGGVILDPFQRDDIVEKSAELEGVEYVGISTN